MPCEGARFRKQEGKAGSLTVRPESIADDAGGNECVEASREVPQGGMSECTGRNASEDLEEASKVTHGRRPAGQTGKAAGWQGRNRYEHRSLSIGVERAARTQRERGQHGKPNAMSEQTQPDAREGQAGSRWVAERPVVSTKPGNAGGEKRPWF